VQTRRQIIAATKTAPAGAVFLCFKPISGNRQTTSKRLVFRDYALDEDNMSRFATLFC
jgi:hypothetical protein